MFTTVEGIDGSGKTTLLEGTEDTDGLKDHFNDAVFTREPDDDTWLGQCVREAISNDGPDVPPMSVFFLFLSEHANHVENTVEPALDAGQDVICDRYMDSRFAYQSYELRNQIDNPLEWIRGIQEQGWAPMPDVTILLDVPVETALSRLDGDEIFEKQERLEYYRQTYLELAEELERYVVVDATQPIPDMIAEAVDAIEAQGA